MAKLFIDILARNIKGVSEALTRSSQHAKTAARTAGTSVGKEYQYGFDSFVMNRSLTTRQQDAFLRTKSTVLGTTFGATKTPLINRNIAGLYGQRGNAALDSFVQAMNFKGGKLSLDAALNSPNVLASRMGTQNLSILRAMIAKDYNHRISQAMYDAIRQESARKYSVNKAGSLGASLLKDEQNKSLQRGMGVFRPSQQLLGDIGKGRFANAGYGLGGMLGGPLGGLLLGAGGLALSAQGLTRNLSERSEIYREIKSYMSGENSKEISTRFDAGLREVINTASVKYGIAGTELSKFVIESLQAGVDEKSIQSILPSAAQIARSYNVPIEEMVELFTTANLSDWIDPNDINSVNNFFGKLIEMVKVSKATIRGFSQSLKYTPALREAGVDADSYLTISAILANQNISGTRAGRTMDAIFGKILVPDGKAGDIESNLLGALTDNGREKFAGSKKDLTRLSQYLAAVKFSAYNEKGELNVGEGKKFKNWTEAFVNLGESINNLSDADKNVLFSKFGQIGKRGSAPLFNNPEELMAMFDKIVNADVIKNIQTAQNITDESLAGSSSKVTSAWQQLVDQTLKLEESFGLIRGTLDSFTATLDLFSKGFELFGKTFSSEYRSKKRDTDTVKQLDKRAESYNVTLTEQFKLGKIPAGAKLADLKPEQLQYLDARFRTYAPTEYDKAEARKHFNITPKDISSAAFAGLDERQLENLQNALVKIQRMEKDAQYKSNVGIVDWLGWEDKDIRTKRQEILNYGISPDMSNLQQLLAQRQQQLKGEVKIIVEDPSGKVLGSVLTPISATKTQTNPVTITLNGMFANPLINGGVQ